MNDLKKIRCMLFRGGTSKGVCLLEEDMPNEIKARDELILRIMGSPDPRQIDGIGGATFTTSKVAIISRSKRSGVDVDYKFLQVGIDKALIDDKPTCGNVLTAVGLFSLENNLAQIKDGQTEVVVYDINTGATIKQRLNTPNKIITYKGDFAIAGVPGLSSPIDLYFTNIAGGKTGHYLPTGQVVDELNGVKVTCLDISMPTVFVNAVDLGYSGHESVNELSDDKSLISKLESIRELASQKMGLGPAKDNVIPKIAMISEASGTNGKKADINIRYFTPLTCHPAIAVSAGFCLSTGCFIEGTLMNGITKQRFRKGKTAVNLQNPSGVTTVEVDFPSDDISEVSGYTKRSARLLFSGHVYV